jgi:hypothetical protein
MNRLLALSIVAAFGLGGAVGALALFAHDPGERASASPPRPVWTETQWPFPMDQWGKGKAYQCKPADCGTKINLYLRAKLGSCNCTAGVEDDDELDRMSDLDLVGGNVLPLGEGRPITVGHMNGRSRAYAFAIRNQSSKTVISVAVNDRCDMIVATVVLSHDQLAAIEPSVIEFLNSGAVLRWAEVVLGI